MYKKILLLLAVVALVASCHRPYDTVFSTYPNGAKKLVFTVIDGDNGEVTRVGEKMYYENGKLMYEKHFKDDQPAGEWKFWYDNGNLHACGNFDKDKEKGSGWQFYDKKGDSFVPDGYDSLVVMDFTTDRRPLSISYYKDSCELRFQFNDNFTLNARGMVRNGKKNGVWEFYYANGQKMLEAMYLEDVENGAYNSYRENGVPYFRGYYINGSRANVWEFYDEEGNLAGRQDFDNP